MKNLCLKLWADLCQDPKKIRDPGSAGSKIWDLGGSWIQNFRFCWGILGILDPAFQILLRDPGDLGSSTSDLSRDPGDSRSCSLHFRFCRGILNPEFSICRGILGILDPAFSIWRGILGILDPAFSICRGILWILGPESTLICLEGLHYDSSVEGLGDIWHWMLYSKLQLDVKLCAYTLTCTLMVHVVTSVLTTYCQALSSEYTEWSVSSTIQILR